MVESPTFADVALNLATTAPPRSMPRSIAIRSAQITTSASSSAAWSFVAREPLMPIRSRSSFFRTLHASPTSPASSVARNARLSGSEPVFHSTLRATLAVRSAAIVTPPSGTATAGAGNSPGFPDSWGAGRAERAKLA